MSSKGGRLLWLLALPLPLLASERDPFLPAEDRCQTAPLAQWRYGGAVGYPHYWVGYLLDHRSQWRRVVAHWRQENDRTNDAHAAALRAVEDTAIRDIVRYQENLGLRGITDGEFLKGVRYFSGGARTQSVAIRSASGTMRYIDATHRWAARQDPAPRVCPERPPRRWVENSA